MSAKPDDKEQYKAVQTTPLEANMEPPLSEKEDTAKKDTAKEKSIEKSNSNSPPEKLPPEDQRQKHSTGVAAPLPAPTPNSTAVPNPVAVPAAVPPLASAPTPLWKGITGMISNTVSKVFGPPREESESESDTGEPSKPPSKPPTQPPSKPPTQSAPLPPPQNATKPNPQDEQELKRARHVAARAYALGLGDKERAYYASTKSHAPVLLHKVPEQKAKRKVFTAPKPQSETERHQAARAFALSGVNNSLVNQHTISAPLSKQHTAAAPLLKHTDNSKSEAATVAIVNPHPGRHPHPGILWPPPTRLLNLKLDDFAKRAGQVGSPGTQVPVPSPPRKLKPSPPSPPPRVRLPKAAFPAAPTGAIGTFLKKQIAAPPPVKKRKYKHGGAVASEKGPVRPSLTVTTGYKELPAKSTVIASTGAAVVGTGNAVALTNASTRRDQAPVFPTTLKTQVMSAASTVARSLNLGPWPSPHQSLDAGAVEKSATKPSSSSLHSQHMSVVAASIQQFAYDVILRSMELEIPDKANESKAFLGTMLILREVLTQNGEGVFGSVASLVDDSKNTSWGNELNQEAKILSHQVLATSVILAGLEAFQGPWSEKLSTDFLCMIDGYDNDSDEVAEYMVAVDKNTAVTLSGGREMSAEERLAWQLSTNLHRDDHPVIKRKREIENAETAETNWKARKIEVASPNACHISILEEASRD
jgi:hypothetical protein